MKPHEETWESVAEFCGHDTDAPGDPERRRLAAQAPAMARLLLEVEWKADQGIDYEVTAPCCPVCGGLKPGAPSLEHVGWPEVLTECGVGHRHDCRLVAVLRAAGVVE
jgi:hypothetical protein